MKTIALALLTAASLVLVAIPAAVQDVQVTVVRLGFSDVTSTFDVAETLPEEV